MGFFLRKVRQQRWLKDGTMTWLSRFDARSDALDDLRTGGDGLSVYAVSDACDVRRIGVALAATADSFTHLDFALFDEVMLGPLGIRVAVSVGTTPDSGVNQTHRDLINLTAYKVATLAELIDRTQLFERIPRKTVIEGIVQETRAGRLDAGHLNTVLKPKVLERL